MVSAVLFEVLSKGRIARLVEDLDDDTVTAIAASSVPLEYAPLDKLLEDWEPEAGR